LREQLGQVSDKLEKLAPEQIDKSVTLHIYGGNNVIAAAAHNINQAGRDVIIAGDTASLAKALIDFGAKKKDAELIIDALEQDGSDGKPSLGKKTIGVVKTIAGKIVSTGKQISVSAATSVITQMILQYLGSSSGIAV